jgi:CubicO group peptidase (beta-lactamase class C family)
VSTLMKDSIPSRPVLLLVAMACLLLLACTADPPEQTPSIPDRERIAAAIDGQAEVINYFDQVRAIVVATDDRIVFEQYYGTDQDAYWGMQSITKSVISTLVGIALEEGLIASIDDTLAQLLPRHADVMSPAVAGTTLRQLLTMTAGFPSGDEVLAPAFTRSEDWVREILTSPEAPPGEGFLYSNGTSHLLAALLEEATGRSALDFARSRLFGPLGIDTRSVFRPVHLQEPRAKEIAAYENADFAWPVDPQGVSTGWWGIKLRPQDMVKLGQLFLGGGRWGDRQVVPAEWVDQATTPQVAVDGLGEGTGYGYQWWTGTVDGDEAFQAMGYGGQLIEVVPARNVVVVTTTEVRLDDITSEGIDLDTLLTLVENAIISHFPAD